MSIVSSRLPVWQVVQSFMQVSEEQVRALCMDFIRAADLDMSIDDYADESLDHMIFVQHMHEICTEEVYGLDINIMVNSTGGDPFYYSRKVKPEELNQYIQSTDCSYYCTICGDNYNEGGVRMSCENRNNCCTFCKDCIVPWITDNVAKCPNCASYVAPIA